MSSIIRTPITGLRVPIHLNEPLIWEEQLSKFDNYIKFAAKQVVSGIDCCFHGADDLYQEGLLLLWQCFERYQYKTKQEFQFLFKSSLWRLLRDKAGKPNKEMTDIEEVFEAEEIGYSDNSLEDMYEEYRMKQVYELLVGNPTAISILKELLNPSKVTVEECDKDMARKEMLKNQGARLNIPTSIEIKPVHIQRALNLTEEIYAKNFKLVQMAIYEVYARDYNIKSYTPNWDDPTWDELDYSAVSATNYEIQVDNPALTNEELDTMVQVIMSDVDELSECDVEKTA